ncbi:MAG: ferrous iron transport protein A [Clostridia bacterium]|nr:ferrous iron transport protein A [Clostridia bacterium]
MKRAQTVTLDRLQEGQCGWLVGLDEEHPLRRRLMDMGWFEGSEILCVRLGPAGDPIAYRTAGVTVALRRRDALRIAVRVCDDSERGESEEYDYIPPQADTSSATGRFEGNMVGGS